MRVTSADMIAQGKHRQSSSYMEYQRLTAFAKEYLVCKCDVDHREHRANYPKPHDWLGYCTLCNLPRWTSAPIVIQICEGCEQYYAPRVTDYRADWRNGQPPFKYRLCFRCDPVVDAEQRRTVRTTKRKFS